MMGMVIGLESCSYNLKKLLFFWIFSILNLPSAFLCRVFFDIRHSLCRVSEKILGKEPFADKMFAEYSLPSVTLGKDFDECKIAFAGKEHDFSSEVINRDGH
jgi:hypothetical protein